MFCYVFSSICWWCLQIDYYIERPHSSSHFYGFIQAGLWTSVNLCREKHTPKTHTVFLISLWWRNQQNFQISRKAPLVSVTPPIPWPLLHIFLKFPHIFVRYLFIIDVNNFFERERKRIPPPLKLQWPTNLKTAPITHPPSPFMFIIECFYPTAGNTVQTFL